MRKPKFSYQITVAEKFFVEKSAELLHKETIDSFRLRIHNPKSLMIELIQVIQDIDLNKLKRKDYAKFLIEEFKRILDEENELEFRSISKKYLLSLIEVVIKGNKLDFKKIYYATNLILRDNQDYLQIIFETIKLNIQELNKKESFKIKELDQLNRLISYFFVELRTRGYSKEYLNNYVRTIFGSGGGTFDDRLSILRNLIYKTNEEFSVIVKIDYPNHLHKSISKYFKNELLQKSDYQRFITKTNQKVADFLKSHKSSLLLSYKVEALDYYSATVKFREKIANKLDILQFGNNKISYGRDIVVIGGNDLKKSDIQNIDYQIDGYYNSGVELLNTFSNKIETIQNSNKISPESINKLTSGARYFRLGNESNEIESKLLNYWIGLEYLFSVYDADEYTLQRIVTNFSNIHSIVYFKKLIEDFHQNLEYLGVHTNILDYSQNLSYLLEETTYTYLESLLQTFPLLAYRASYFKERLLAPEKIKATLKKHRQNIVWNLNRIYRLRNEIVHDAAHKKDITTITAHIKYYLIFTITSLIHFFTEEPVDINLDNKISIEDFFMLQELRLENIDKNGNLLKDFVSISNPLKNVLK